MKKVLLMLLFLFFLLLVASTSYGYIYFQSQNIIDVNKPEIYFSADNFKEILIGYSNVSLKILNGDITDLKKVWFYRLKKVNENHYKIILPKKSGAYFVIIFGKDTSKMQTFFLTRLKGWAIKGNKNFFVVYDTKNKKFLDEIYTYSKNGEKVKLNGPIFPAKPEYSGLFFVGNDVIYFLNPSFSFFREMYSKNKAVVILDRPIYKPGQMIFGRVNLFEREGERYVPIKGEAVISIKDPYGNIIYNERIQTNENGAYQLKYKTTQEITMGYYWIEVDFKGKKFYKDFLIEDYIKPSFEIFADVKPEFIVSGDKILLKVNLNYLDGKPVSGAQVLLYSYEYIDFYEEKLFHKESKYTDRKGEAKFTLQTSKNYTGFIRFQILVNDESGILLEKNLNVDIHGDRVKISGKFMRMNGKNYIKLRITDPQGNPLSGKGSIWLNEKEKFFELKNGEAIVEIGYAWKIKVAFKNEYRIFYLWEYRQEITGDERISLNVDMKECELHAGDEFKISVSTDSPGILVYGGERIDGIFLVEDKLEKFVKIKDDEFSNRYFIVFRTVDGREKRLFYPIVHENRVEKLDIVTDKQTYEPKEMIHVFFKNAKEDESKVISVVDKGIYLIQENDFSISKALYPDMSYPSFWILNSYNYIGSRSLSLLEEKVKEHLFTSTKEGGGISVRKYFPDTAYWNYDTSRNELNFIAPDTITTWVINAISISKNGIKEGKKEIKVTKPFEVKLFTPPFLIEGDSFTGYIVVKNTTGKYGKVNIDLDVNNAILNFKNGEYDLKENLSLPFRINNVRKGFYVIARARFYDQQDAIKVCPPVHDELFERHISRIVKVDGVYRVKKDMNVKVIKDIKDIIAPSISALIHYPYGCTEQTMSSFYPAVIAKGIVDINDLDDIVLKGIHRLIKFQHADGGWGWWEEDDSNLFMTNYVLEGLYFALKKGYSIPEDVIENGLRFVEESKKTGYSCFILSLYGKDLNCKPTERNTIDLLYTSPDDIKDLAIVDENTAYIPSHEAWFHSSIEYTAIAARTLTRFGKYTDLRDKFVNYLLNTRKNIFWHSTKDTALSILSIMEANPAFESDVKVFEKDGEKICMGNGWVLIEGVEKYIPKTKNEMIKIQIENYKRYEVRYEDQYLDAFINDVCNYIPVKVEKIESTPTLTFRTSIPNEVKEVIKVGTILSYDSTENALIVSPPISFQGNTGYSFGKPPEDSKDEKVYFKIYLRLKKPEDRIMKVGDVYKTVIKMKGYGEYIIIEENLPACVQVLKHYVERDSTYGKFWWDESDDGYSIVTGFESKLDRLAFFLLELKDGKIQYYWRVTSEGKFTKKPTHVYSMYSDLIDSYTDYKSFTTSGR